MVDVHPLLPQRQSAVLFVIPPVWVQLGAARQMQYLELDEEHDAVEVDKVLNMRRVLPS